MFASYVYEKSAAEYTNKLILIDADGLEAQMNYCSYFEARGFAVIHYENDLNLRVEHEDAITSEDDAFLLLVQPGNYVPYDIIRRYKSFEVSFEKLFSKLNAGAIKEARRKLDLLSSAYRANYNECQSADQTKRFIQENVYSRENVDQYLQTLLAGLNNAVAEAKGYKDWFRIAKLKANIDTMAMEHGITIDAGHINQPFVDFILSDFGKLSSVIDRSGPVLVSRAMEYIHDHSEKFVIIVMDGMSKFDWKIISASFDSIKYEEAAAFAMIPTTTSISRQCLLSSKYPSQLVAPWKQSKEKAEFIACAQGLGYAYEQIAYERGYDADFNSAIKCGAIIINDIDDMVHGQKQGRIGMFNDITVLAKQTKLRDTVKRLLKKGFDIYIAADHGNTPCVGIGKLMKTGVEVETKSRRMLVLKDFSDKLALIDQYDLIDYPKYFLNKDFDYLICNVGCSFDAKDEEVISHGGITIDEVIVPFIKIKAVEYNG